MNSYNQFLSKERFPITAVCIGPSNFDFIACGNLEGTLFVYSYKKNFSVTNKLLYSKIFPCGILSLCFVPAKNFLLIGFFDGLLAVHDLSSQQEIELAKHEVGVSNVTYLDRSDTFLSTGWDGKIFVGSMTEMKVFNEIQLTYSIHYLAINEPYLVVAGGDKDASVFNTDDVLTPNFVAVFTFKLRVDYFVYCICLAKDEIGNLIITTGDVLGNVLIFQTNPSTPTFIQENK